MIDFIYSDTFRNLGKFTGTLILGSMIIGILGYYLTKEGKE